MQKNKFLFAVLTASLLTGALVGCGGGKNSSNHGSTAGEGDSSLSSSNSVYDPDDPNNSVSSGTIIRDNDFNRALEFKYDSYTLTYDQLYNGESIEEYGYIYYTGGISYVLDYTNVEATGVYEYMYYANYKDDSYMYWQKKQGYVYDGWVANGYHDADLGMYNAYFDFDRFLHTITADDVEYVLGAFYVKESSMYKYKRQGLEFFGDPFFSVEEITTIGFLMDKDTGAITRIIGACDEKSDNGFQIKIEYVNETPVPQQALKIKAPYYNSESDRNIYTYKEMKGADYVPDVWPTSVTLKTVGEVTKETGYDAVIDIADSVELEYTILPENVNRIEFNWITSDESVIDLNYKANFTSHHKYATGVKEGEALVSIKLQKQDGTWMESNKLKIKVKPLATQDKTNAVYDLTITGSSYKTETVDGKEVVDKNTTIFSAYNAINTTAKFSIKAHNAAAFEAKNTDSFGENGMVMVVSPANQEYMNNGFYTEVIFDFGDQEVVSMNFYYALYKSNQRGAALSNMSEAYIQTSSNGVEWSSPIDIKPEMQANFEKVNLDYEAQLKLMTRKFEKASKVRLYFKANQVGNNYWIAMNNFVFSNDSTCHNHESDAIPVSKVNASVPATSVKVGKTLQFGATVEPENATYTQLSWVSSDPTVGTINAMGMFLGVKEGKTTVYALAHNGVKSQEFEITVIGQEYLDAKYVGNKYLSDEVFANSTWYDVEFSVLTNTTAKLDIKPDGGELTTINFTYYTKDDSSRPVHTFNGENGELLEVQFYDSRVEVFLKNCSVLTLGNTFTNSGEELALYVKATSIQLTHNSSVVTETTMKVGETYNFFAKAKPTNASYQSCEATSENTAVATVVKESNGSFTVTAVAAGETNISVKNADNVETKLKVTVTAVVGVSSISLTANKTSIEAGQTATLTATIAPANANSMNLEWASSNSGVATVRGNGTSATVTGVKSGTAVISITDKVSGKTATVTITVTASTAAIDTRYVGRYTGNTDDGCVFFFDVFADGTAKLTVLDYDGYVDASYEFTAMSTVFDGNNISFTYNEDEDVKLGIYNDTLYVYDDDFTLGIAYGDSLSIEKIS